MEIPLEAACHASMHTRQHEVDISEYGPNPNVLWLQSEMGCRFTIPVSGSDSRREGVPISMRLRPLSFEAASPLANEGQLLMTIFALDQAEEEIFAHQISDEALEMAAGCETAANYTLYFCTSLDLCPGP